MSNENLTTNENTEKTGESYVIGSFDTATKTRRIEWRDTGMVRTVSTWEESADLLWDLHHETFSHIWRRNIIGVVDDPQVQRHMLGYLIGVADGIWSVTDTDDSKGVVNNHFVSIDKITDRIIEKLTEMPDEPSIDDLLAMLFGDRTVTEVDIEDITEGDTKETE